MDTYGQRLQKIQNAIDNILISGQSYELDGKKYTKANLAELYALENRYLDLVAKFGADSNALTQKQYRRIKGVRFAN